MRRDPAGPGSRGGNRRLDTVEDARDYVAGFPEVFGGLRVEGDEVVVAFTGDLEKHLAALRAWVEHPELVRVEQATYPLAKLEADIRAIRNRLRDDPRHPELAGRPGHIQLKAGCADLATELHRMYGNALDVTVGRKPFPPETVADRRPAPIPTATLTIPGLELTVALDAPTVVGGEDLQGTVRFANRGAQRVEGLTGVLTGGVRGEGDDFMAGGFVGFVPLVAHQVKLEPEECMRLELVVGTSSCLHDTSYVVPPGRYEVIAIIPFDRADTPPGIHPHLVARGAWITVQPD